MKQLYQVGQRVAFIARNEVALGDLIVTGKWQHHVGFVKQVRRSILRKRYVLILPKSTEIFIVPQRDIIGVVERRENDLNKSNKSNENGNI